MRLQISSHWTKPWRRPYRSDLADLDRREPTVEAESVITHAQPPSYHYMVATMFGTVIVIGTAAFEKPTGPTTLA